MAETPVQVIVAAYPTPDGASKKMEELQQAHREGLIGVIDMAVVVKGADGKLKIINSKRRGTRGFITGGVVGGLVGLLAGPVGWAALGGGAVGALAGRIRGLPLKRELTDLGESLTPNSSAIVAVVEHTWVADLERELAAQDAKVVHDTIKADIAAQLEAGGSVLYSLGATSTGAAAVRAATSEGVTTVEGVVVTPDRVSAFAATSEGADVEHATLTDEKQSEQSGGAAAGSGAPGAAGAAGPGDAPAAPPTGPSETGR